MWKIGGKKQFSFDGKECEQKLHGELERKIALLVKEKLAQFQTALSLNTKKSFIK